MNFIRANDIIINYLDEGNPAGTVLVFINSLGTDMRIWDTMMPYFLSDYRIIRHDKRGHGLSECSPAPYSIHQHTQDLLALLDCLGIHQAIICGISVGGMIAMDLAACEPTRVKKLILCDTAPKIGTPSMWNERIQSLSDNGMSHLGEAILARWFAPEFVSNQPAAYRGYYNMLTRTPVDGYTGTCAAIRDADLWPHIPKMQIPTLVLCGAKDLATTPQDAVTLANMLPKAACQLIADAAHLPCIEQPVKMAAMITTFLSESE